jgi:hypothetical protein
MSTGRPILLAIQHVSWGEGELFTRSTPSFQAFAGLVTNNRPA